MSAPESQPGVPFLDLRRELAEVRDELDAAWSRVVGSGAFVLGPELERFEAELAERVGVRHAIGVASGTDALILALEALDVGPGDEVITSPFSFFATAGAVLRVGATPVFADVVPDTLNLDPEAVEAAVTSRTAALLPVHLYGQMARADALDHVARRHGLAVVEDAAQAIGASGRLEGREVVAGSWGTAGCFSFYPTKNLAALGDGGMVTTDDAALAARLRRLRVHGRPADDGRHLEVGHNSRLDALQAAALRVKLPRLDDWTRRRREHARAYDRALGAVDGLRLPVERPGNRHVYHQYTVRCADRAEVRERLDRASVGHAVYYPVPLHLQEALAGLGGRPGDFPEAERAAAEVVSLPVFPALLAEERARVVEALGGDVEAAP